ncbi:MAG: ImmA/IrrE family metallo-endopeptidase [Alphaproteobacteria bacterium]|nr:ImmA/IrrE family metallo-endopeptidase [Alphaproteobacteria bacterium]
MAFINIEDPIVKSTPSLDELENLLKRHNHPIDVRAIAKELGISIIDDVDMDKDISGRLVFQSGKWYIYVNAFHNEKRKRFTIAHEVAHYILHKKEKHEFNDVSFFRSPDHSVEEVEANRLAAKILMPEQPFIDEIKKGNNSLLQLAAIFNVSGMACEYRAKDLGLLSK